jgi:hypothetical protein
MAYTGRGRRHEKIYKLKHDLLDRILNGKAGQKVRVKIDRVGNRSATATIV